MQNNLFIVSCRGLDQEAGGPSDVGPNSFQRPRQDRCHAQQLIHEEPLVRGQWEASRWDPASIHLRQRPRFLRSGVLVPLPQCISNPSIHFMFLYLHATLYTFDTHSRSSDPQRKYEEYGLKPYVAHATFQYSGTPGKRNRFREFLLWDDPPEYFANEKGYIHFK